MAEPKPKKESKKAGRPPKFSKATADKFLTAIAAGNTRKASCLHAGFSEDTLARWLRGEGGKEGKAAIEGFADFADALTRAEADAEVRCEAIVQKAAQGYDSGHTKRTTKTVLEKRTIKHPDGTVITEMVPIQIVTEEVITEREFDWKAAAFWLERRRVQDWGSRQKVEVTGADGGPIETAPAFDLSKLSEDELIIYERLRSKSAAA